jgi:hypothetical protein
VKRKTETVESDEFPKPWDDTPITRTAWLKWRDRLLASEAPGRRPQGWWKYEHQKDPPEGIDGSIYLWRIGELRGGERAQVEAWWRTYYDEARKLPDRTAYWRWKDIPPELVELWDQRAVK